ncbi:hypothetical protein SDC9_151102 [bioreactor metagenome]|uniref:Uncharacterized protein n=1 Tax=bioreactor metagenome TaxID=1076179 RepID=A0A645EPD0_9ZZZZ
MAIKNASADLASPESISLARKSLIALVMATPGTKSMRAPMVIGTELLPNPMAVLTSAKNAAKAVQQNPFIK